MITESLVQEFRESDSTRRQMVLWQLVHELTIESREYYPIDEVVSRERIVAINEVIHRLSGLGRDLVIEERPSGLIQAVIEMLMEAAAEVGGEKIRRSFARALVVIDGKTSTVDS